jgi:hypothetical protein
VIETALDALALIGLDRDRAIDLCAEDAGVR